MNTERLDPMLSSLRRILVAVDASPHSLAALQQAMTLSQRLNAELTAVFVEDVNVLRLGDLRVARHIAYSGEQIALEPSSVEAMIRSQIGRVRAAIDALSRESGISVGFRIVRGRVSEQLLAAASDVDLLVLGCSSAPSEQHRRLGTTARSLAARSSGPVLLLRKGALALKGPVAVLFDGGKSGERALAEAAALARTDSNRLIVLLAPNPGQDETVEALKARVTQLLEGGGYELHFQRVNTGDPSRISKSLSYTGAGILVLAGDSRLLNEGGTENRENRSPDLFGFPLLIVR